MSVHKANDKTEKIPALMEDKFLVLTALTDRFCKEHLSDGYADLARKALAALCRKRPSPLIRGRTDVWACAVIYALGQINFLQDRTQKPYMTSEELCRSFGVAFSTASNKAKQVRDMLEISHFNYHWMLPDKLEGFSPVWMLAVNGLIVDIRKMPRAIQEDAFKRGMIPYIPDDRKPPHPHQAERDQLYEAYGRLREINTEHQTELATQLLKDGLIAPIAKRIGLMDADGSVFVDDDEDDVFETLAPAFDLALYTPAADGINAIQHYALERTPLLTGKERRVLDAMGAARFSVYRIDRKHEMAGVWLADMIHGGEVWLMDRSMDANAQPSMVFGMRLFKPDDFWMTTGLAVPTEMTTSNTDVSKPSESPKESQNTIDCDKLAEDMYRGFFGEAA